MNDPVEKVLAYLAGQKKIEDVPVDELQALGEENPYFPVTQFLLAKKLKGENTNAYSVQVQKTALYFSNHYWLNYLLSGDVGIEHSSAITKQDEDKFIIKEPAATTAHLDLVTNSTGNDVFGVENSTFKDRLVIPGAEPSVNNGISHDIAPTSDHKDMEVHTTARVESHQGEEEMAVIARETNEAAETFIDQLEPATIPDRAMPSIEKIAPAAQKEVSELAEEMAGAGHSVDEATEHFLEDIDDTDRRDDTALDDEHDRMFRNIKAMLDATSEDADADTQNAVVPIDPYYTIDYFASQGIKLELEKYPEDQLGQHLKKFTQWLKHMKKLGPEDATEVISRTESEADIQQIADSSNTVREVVTEAMALVLEKQGKKDKAIELYNKLSFLNPDKRVYFADKIKKLKGF